MQFCLRPTVSSRFAGSAVDPRSVMRLFGVDRCFVIFFTLDSSILDKVGQRVRLPALGLGSCRHARDSAAELVFNC